MQKLDFNTKNLVYFEKEEKKSNHKMPLHFAAENGHFAK